MKNLVWLLFVVSVAQAAATPRLDDFAYAADILLQGDGAIYRLDLTKRVYQGVTRADLGDLRVFNAGGNPVPHSLVLSADEQAKAVTQHELPLFPLYQDEAGDGAGVRLRIEQGASVQRIVLERTGGDAERRISGYILDGRDLDAPVHRFSFDWDSEQDFLVRVDLEAGDDLESWRGVARNVTLANLHHLGRHLQRNRIEVNPVKAGYFRLRFKEPDQAIELAAVQASGSHVSHITHYEDLTLPVLPGGEAGEYLFELPTGLRGEWLSIHLPEVNTLVGAGLASRSSTDQPWAQRRQVTLYRLRQQGVELVNDDLSLGRGQDRYWRLTVDRSGGGLGEGLPEISLRWRPHELRFVARGDGPFTLAWGSARPMPAAPASTNGMLRQTGLAAEPAELTGAVRQVGGDGVLRPPIDWRQWLLWTVLVLGAGLLLWMAWRQFRHMNEGRR
jgi:hypothetical protein